MINLGDYSGVSVGAIFPENDVEGSIEGSGDQKYAVLKELRKKYPKVENVYSPIKAFPFVADCVKLDEGIKNLSDEILELQKVTPALTGYELATSSDANVVKLELLRRINLEYKRVFNKQICTDTLEQMKAEADAKVLTKESVKAEKKILEKNYKEQYLYIGFGAVILLVGLFVVTRNRK